MPLSPKKVHSLKGMAVPLEVDVRSYVPGYMIKCSSLEGSTSILT